MKALLELFVLSVILAFTTLTVAHCQETPTFDQGWQPLRDAPSTAQPPVKLNLWGQFKESWSTQWDPNTPMASTWEPFRSPSFVITGVALMGATVTDVLISQHDFRNGCVEGTGDANRRPSMAEQMTENMGLSLFVAGGSYFLKRKHIKVLPEAFMAIGIGKHAKGIVNGLQSVCY